jgi:rod shape determining protein RodA
MISRELTGGNKIDYVLMSLYLSLVGIGWLMIYAVGHTKYAEMEFAEFLVKSPAGKQAIFIGVSMVLLLLIITIDGKFWRIFAYPIYAVGIVLLMLVLIFGREINGAKAWFSIAGFGFQPVEVAKIGTALALSSFLSSPSISLRDRNTLLTVLGLLAVPIFFIMLQPDAGSMLVFISFSIMLFREGLSPLPYIVGLLMATVLIMALMFNANELVMYMMMLVALIFSFSINENQKVWLAGVVAVIGLSAFSYFNWNPQMGLNLMLLTILGFIVVHSRRGRFRLVIITTVALVVSTVLVYSTSFLVNNVLKHHQQERINVWLRIDKCDPRGAAYNVIQSKMAIGSGSIQGKGFLEGTMTKLSYIPEQQTDFIFCTIGEEHGFIGVFALIAIFVMLLFRMIQIGERHKSNFVRLYAYCLVGIFFFHLFINVGMTMGLLPVVGIPLPFVSAGGSSLLSFTAMIGILLKLDSNRYSS